MWYLILSICASSAIFVIFRLFEKRKVDNLAAIVVNYFVAASLGFAFKLPEKALYEYPWFWNSLLLGFVFISLFVLMARVTREIGISVAAVANKLSVIIPILFAILFLKETVSLIAWLGIALSLCGTFLALYNKEKLQAPVYLALLLFFGSGALDALLKYNQLGFESTNDQLWFSSSIFLSAGIIGSIYFLVKRQKLQFNGKNLLWGSILGIPNFFSIFLILQTLTAFNLESAKIFPINNLGVVVVASFVSFLVFKEKRSLRNKLGLAIALLGLLLIVYSL